MAAIRHGRIQLPGDVAATVSPRNKTPRRTPRTTCRRCQNDIYGVQYTAPNTAGGCGPQYCHYALSN